MVDAEKGSSAASGDGREGGMKSNLSFLVFAFYLLTGLFSVAARAEEQISVERCIQILDARTEGVEARLVRFEEARTFPFRSKPTTLSGIARISDELGVSIEYPSKSAVMLVDDEGMLLRRLKEGGKPRERAIDAKEGQAADLIAATMEFDKEALLRLFELSATGSEDDWTLTLIPKSELDSNVEKMSIQSDDEAVRRILVELEGRRSVQIDILEERALDGFSEEERARYFRAGE